MMSTKHNGCVDEAPLKLKVIFCKLLQRVIKLDLSCINNLIFFIIPFTNAPKKVPNNELHPWNGLLTAKHGFSGAAVCSSHCIVHTSNDLDVTSSSSNSKS